MRNPTLHMCSLVIIPLRALSVLIVCSVVEEKERTDNQRHCTCVTGFVKLALSVDTMMLCRNCSLDGQ